MCLLKLQNPGIMKKNYGIERTKKKFEKQDLFDYKMATSKHWVRFNIFMSFTIGLQLLLPHCV
jgi:hypothetical protein